MNDYISLQSVTPDDGGIFTALNSFSVPWKNTVSPELIDLQYYGNVSGEKIIAPLVYKQLNSEGKLTVAKQALIASMIFSMFGTNWTKEWETLSMQYDPIANYDMTETMTDDETVTDYGKTNTRTNNLTHAKTGTETDAPSVSVTTNDTVHGFNSSNAVPTDGRSQSTSGSDVTTYNTSDTDTGTVTDVGSGSDTSTRNYELTRKGNIGVTSSQQLLQSERDLWVWNYFLDVVFPDVDKILTIPIYAEETNFTGSAAEPTGTINIVENGLHIDIKQFAFADVVVPNTYTEEDQGKVVSGDDLVSQTSRAITENDTYDTTTNNSITVNVPNSYSAADEGKVVSDGSLVSQTSRTIIENDTYDTTTNNSVIVNVPTSSIIKGTTPPSGGSEGDLYLQTAHLPDNITFVEYLQSTGNSDTYIDTGVYATQDIDVVLTADRGNGTSGSGAYTGCPLGVRTGGFDSMKKSLYLGAHSDNNGAISCTKSGSGSSKTGSVYNKTGVSTRRTQTLYSNSGDTIYSATIDTTTYDALYTQTAANGSWQSDHTIHLFAFYTGNTFNATGVAKVHRATLYDKNGLLKDYLPAIDGNGVPCMYEAVSGQFVYNDANGTFLYGNVITPEEFNTLYVKKNNTWSAIANNVSVE